ncbi:MAG: hypothetical protein ACRD3M_19665 [Thermoanaerobaculia bacterium]
MKKLLGIALGGLIALAGLAASGSAKDKEALRCRLTEKTVEECCCVEQEDGKLLCTLANQTVDPCCCEPAER